MERFLLLPGKHYITICILTIFCMSHFDVHAQKVIPDSLLHQQWEDESCKYNRWTKGCDSIDYHKPGITFYYNIDSICHLIATREFSKISGEVFYFYYIVDISGPERRLIDRPKLVKNIEHYKNKKLEKELDVYDTYASFQNGFQHSEEWNMLWSLVEKYERKGDLQTKLRIMQRLLFACSGFPTHVVTQRVDKDRLPVIKLINEILSTLERLNGEPYLFEPGYFYRQIGQIYYSFGYYNKAIPLLWKALEQPQEHYYNRNIMRARDYLGAYYSKTRNYNLSDSLYLSILKSHDNVEYRPIDDVVAIGGLAANANARGNKEEAMRLYTIALPHTLKEKDFPLAGSYALRIGRLYMEKGELNKTREMIDSARIYLIKGNLPVRNWERFYTLSRDYYLKINRSDMAAAYIDSVTSIQAQTDSLFNTRVMAYAEYEAFEMEKALKEEQISTQQLRIIFISIILALCLISLIILFYYYRRLKEKNRTLAEKSRQWAEQVQEDYQPNINKAPESATVDEVRIMQQVYDYIIINKNYLDAELSLDKLSRELGVNRSYLSSAINSVTGKNFNAYINEYRISEAIRMLNDTEKEPVSIDDIYLACGFNSKRSFFHSFKKITGITSGEYRENLGKHSAE